MLRGWIEIQLENGQRFKYVRDYTFTGSGDTITASDAVQYANSYLYGDTVGDTYLYQGDSFEIKYAFDTLLTNSSSGDSLLVFPETAGDTYVIVRPNYDQPQTPARQNSGGDTDIQLTLSYRRIAVRTDAIVSIAVAEEYVPPTNVYVP